MKTKRYLFAVLFLAISVIGWSGGSKETQAAEKQVPAAQTKEAAGSGPVQPKGYPSRPINWIVPAAAGAAHDLPSRALADILKLGKPVVVENIAGGNQTIGTAAAVTRPADGQTMLTMANACGITQPLMTKVSYKLADLRPIAMLAPFVQCAVVVKSDSMIKTVDDWIALLKSGQKYSYGVTNAGGFGHMAIASTLSQLGFYGDPKGVMVVYNGSAQNITALLSGEPSFIIADVTDVVTRAKSGEVRVLTILHDEICSLFPDVPLITKFGVKNMGTFVGLKWIAVRADTPKDVVNWLKLKLNEAIQSETYQNYLVKILETAGKDYGEVMRKTGIIK